MQGRRAGRDGGAFWLLPTTLLRSFPPGLCEGPLSGCLRSPPPKKKPLWGSLSNFRVHGKQHPPKERQAGLFLGGDVKKRGGTTGSPLELRPFQVGGSHHALREIKTKYNFLYSRVSMGGALHPPFGGAETPPRSQAPPPTQSRVLPCGPGRRRSPL